MGDDSRPPVARWTVQWWVSAGDWDVHGRSGLATVVGDDERKARQTARDWTAVAARWPRAHVRMWRQHRAVWQTRTDRGSRWQVGRWEDTFDGDGKRRGLSWTHDLHDDETERQREIGLTGGAA